MSLHLKVKTRRGEHEFDVKSSALSLLETIEDHKIKMPFGCRAGSCGVCCVDILEGREFLEETNLVEEDTLTRAGFKSSEKRLACRARLKAGVSGIISLAVSEETK